MKFFHLSDLHIGLKLINRDLGEDQKYIFDRIADYARQEQPDAIVIAGDIYDKAVPSAEAVDLFDGFVSALRQAAPECVIMMISGNHDSGPRVNVFRSVLCRQNIHMIGMPPQREEDRIEKVTLKDAGGDVHFYLLPFVKPSMVKAIVGTDENGNNLSYEASLRALLAREQIKTDDRNILVSHQFYLPAGTEADQVQRMESEICTVGNIDAISADVLKPFDYCALGHIHKPMNAGSDMWRYCGTPMACSISEAGQEKGIVVVETERKGDLHIRVLPLVPLRQVKVIRGELRQVLEQACEDYVTVVLTDKVDLDVLDMQDRIRAAFPYLLDIRRETERRADYGTKISEEADLDPFRLCCSFLKETDEFERELLMEIIDKVQEVAE